MKSKAKVDIPWGWDMMNGFLVALCTMIQMRYMSSLDFYYIPKQQGLKINEI